MMAELSAWLLRKHCLQHADPLFDRDENGRAVFRCPECLHAWPILPGFQPRPPQPATSIAVHEPRPPAERKHRPVRTGSQRRVLNVGVPMHTSGTSRHCGAGR